jgi:hypothetical protein
VPKPVAPLASNGAQEERPRPEKTSDGADKPLPRVMPPLPDYVTNTLENRAPLGSPDNPIVQLDRR